MQLHAYLWLSVLAALLGTVTARNVIRMDVQEDKEENSDVLLFKPSENKDASFQDTRKVAHQGSTNSVSCTDGTKCPDGNTCCLDAQGEYACCPHPEAVCCDDHVHCCPQNYTCDVKAGKCNQGNASVPVSVKGPVLSQAPTDSSNLSDKAIPCPGGHESCPNNRTCCEMTTGHFGCCPFPKAVCCVDRVHCCPSGYKCDLSTGTCKNGKDELAWFPKQIDSAVRQSITCPDNSTCLDGETCCAGQQGGYACCPLAQAVCCSDGFHCCPEGYMCDAATAACVKGQDSIKWISKKANRPAPPAVHLVVCPDHSRCLDGQTCCEDRQGGYGCCPFPDAVCCSDKLHCCPSGYTCNLSASRCEKGDEILAWSSRLPSTVGPDMSTVTCPDRSTCPQQSTCCAVEGGKYACCPLSKAVCCKDKRHCCPHGFKCNPATERCERGEEFLNWLTKVPSIPAPVVNTITYPDQSTCPDGQTCCAAKSGGFACCPLPNAVCCSDKEHCCPAGYTCDVGAGTCNKGSDRQTWLTKMSSKSSPVQTDVTCRDQTECPSGDTCCENQQGGYGCCPLPNAVCCSDKEHCCPAGYTCDVGAGTCNKGSDRLTWLTKMFSKSSPVKSDITCLDQSQCPSGDTCCENQQGGYGCCPLPNAVCCSDKEHCCPAGYTCDVGAGTCNKGSDRLTWLTKMFSKSSPVNTDVTCLDQSECPSGDTCCENQQGGYGCCPLPNAVCCSDKEHCCPAGYTCDVGAGTCNKGSDRLTWLTKMFSKSSPVKTDVTCRDQSECPSGDTCCENQQGGYGCCPLPNAVCCSDNEHCCPAGYTCDVGAGTCNKGSDRQTWLTKLSSKSSPVELDITCPDQSECPSGNTCCKNEQGGYGCCPLPNAVCCSDGVHCCPAGYTCDVGAGTCYSGSDRLTWLTKMSSKSSPVKTDVTCVDQSECPSGSTCCKNQQGGYSCCPLPN
ncbi:granulin epithelin variant 1, partial [Plakobranchus ocellatus]